MTTQKLVGSFTDSFDKHLNINIRTHHLDSVLILQIVASLYSFFLFKLLCSDTPEDQLGR